MIYPSHNKTLKKLFNAYLHLQFKKFFNHFFVVGDIPVINDRSKSILVLPNHFSWWDGFFVDFVYRKFFAEYKIFMMILEETLRRYPFFKYFGTFSINLSKPKSILESFEYSWNLLKQKNTFLVIFPQGQLEPYSTKVNLKTGIERFIFRKEGDFYVMNLAMKILYLNQKKPDVYFRFTHPVNSKKYSVSFQTLTQDFTENLNLLELDILKKEKLTRIF